MTMISEWLDKELPDSDAEWRLQQTRDRNNAAQLVEVHISEVELPALIVVEADEEQEVLDQVVTQED